jgi:hypothetical protein
MGNARSLGTWNGQNEGFTLFLFILSLMQLTTMSHCNIWLAEGIHCLINKYTYNYIKVKIMKKKNYLLLATAAIALVACTADDDLSAGKSTTAQGDGAIVFNMNTPAMTRAERTAGDAASDLSNEFIVWGEKNEGVSGYTDETKVFENYRVQYTSGSKGTTISNTDDWEYVGITPYSSDYVSPSINGNATTNLKTQTIKYWDTSATNYVFTAVSAPTAQITDGRVKIEKEVTNTGFNKGYTITLKQNASSQNATPDNVYVSDREVITDVTNAKSKAVKLTFRNFMSKVRFGIYENIPGYKVVITGISATDANGTTKNYTNTDKGFGVTNGAIIVPGADTKYTVTYESSNTANNQNKAKVAIAANTTPSSVSYIYTGGTDWLSTQFVSLTSNDNKFISESAASPTYDLTTTKSVTTNGTTAQVTTVGDYTTILPYPSNNKGLKLTLSYNLYSVDTGEKVSVTNKTAVVPAAYCQWKSNYAYTYIFKITDKSAELFPITFDAVVETEENGTQETITTVSDPSITTFAVTSTSSNTVVTGQEEYRAGNVIYASVVDADATSTLGGAAALTAGTNINLYTVTTTNDDKTTITEAAVANCLAQTKYKTNTTATTFTNGELTVTSENITSSNIVSAVPTEEGTDVTRNLNALKWTTSGQASADVYYVVEYIKTSGDNQNPTKTYYYKVVKVAKTN